MIKLRQITRILALILSLKGACALSSSPAKLPSRRDCLHLTSFISAVALTNDQSRSANAYPIQQSDMQNVDTKLPYLATEYFEPAKKIPSAGRSSLAFTPPFQNRATYQYDVGRNTWAFEQLLTFANVTATIRCHVVQLEMTGGLWVHSPQWPTAEFCKQLESLGRPIEHVVLPCNALEHKAPMKAFLKRYPKASVWISPGQYGPFGSCGLSKRESINMGYKVDGILGDPTSEAPVWASEFDIATFYVSIPKNAGPVSEVAFCHKPTKTLIATDAVVFIPDEKSVNKEIFTTYFQDPLVTEDETFWTRTALQAVFLPLRTDQNGAYPGFDALQNRLVRAPILRAFVDARAPDLVQKWTDQIATWEFDRILTSHFASPIVASPRDFSDAFNYLRGDRGSSRLPPIACQDWQLLQGLNDVIADYNLGAPAIYNYQTGCKVD